MTDDRTALRQAVMALPTWGDDIITYASGPLISREAVLALLPSQAEPAAPDRSALTELRDKMRVVADAEGNVDAALWAGELDALLSETERTGSCSRAVDVGLDPSVLTLEPAGQTIFARVDGLAPTIENVRRVSDALGSLLAAPLAARPPAESGEL